MNEHILIDALAYDPPLYEALEDTLWAVNHKVIPTYSLASNLSPEAIQELGDYAYQQGAMWDARSELQC